MSHDEPRLQLHAYLKSLSGYRGAPLHVDLCFYVCNPKKYAPKSVYYSCLRICLLLNISDMLNFEVSTTPKSLRLHLKVFYYS